MECKPFSSFFPKKVKTLSPIMEKGFIIKLLIGRNNNFAVFVVTTFWAQVMRLD